MGFLTTLANFASLGILIYLIIEVRAIRKAVGSGSIRPIETETTIPTTDHAIGSSGGWVVWLFKDGRWTLSQKQVNKGYVHGPPPAFPGRYEGQRVQQDAVRDPSKN